MKNDPNTKNVIIATVLSAIILFGWNFGWQYFFPKPATAPAATQETLDNKAAAQAAKPVDRQVALGTLPRIPIDTPELTGSLNLKGASLDDLKFKLYRETVDASSPPVTLLTPAGASNAYFVQQGMINSEGYKTKTPDDTTVWTAPAGAKLTIGQPVTLSWENGEGVIFSRQISVDDNYVFTVTQSVTNNGQTPLSLLPYGLVVRHDTPHIAGYYVFYEGMLGVLDGKLHEVHYKDVKEATEPVLIESSGGWLGYTDKYWATAMVPDQTKAIKARFRHSTMGERDVYQTEYVSRDALVVAPGATGTSKDLVFAGPKVVQMIDNIGEQYKIPMFELMIDWGWFKPITRPMFWLLETIKSFVGNFGLAILITTVLVKIAVFPIANRAYASMSKMKKLAPEMKRLKELYPDDRLKQQQEMMELYKREKISPAAGCLPMFVQIPIFFSLYKVILTSIELRHAPFYGWIKDLSVADPTNLFTLFGLIPWHAPTYLHIGIWPLLMGITMWVQMRLNPPPPDPVQQAMFNWMPLIFTYMLKDFPAGLVMYWAWSNLLGIIQQSYIMKKHGTEITLFGNIADSLPFIKKKSKPS